MSQSRGPSAVQGQKEEGVSLRARRDHGPSGEANDLPGDLVLKVLLAFGIRLRKKCATVRP